MLRRQILKAPMSWLKAAVDEVKASGTVGSLRRADPYLLTREALGIEA